METFVIPGLDAHKVRGSLAFGRTIDLGFSAHQERAWGGLKVTDLTVHRERFSMSQMFITNISKILACDRGYLKSMLYIYIDIRLCMMFDILYVIFIIPISYGIILWIIYINLWCCVRYLFLYTGRGIYTSISLWNTLNADGFIREIIFLSQ